MFHRLGSFVTRHWVLVILGWLALAVGLKLAAPAWDDVTFDGDLAHLPTEMASIQGGLLLDRAFPDDKSKSQVVLVIAREGEKLRRNDKLFAHKLADAMRHLETGEGQGIVDVLTTRSEVIGDMLKSRNKRAQLVVLQLSGEFMATTNMPLLEQVAANRDQLIDEYEQELGDAGAVWRAGLQVGITGSAAIGGDMLSAAAESIANTETMTIVLVVVILLFVYRAPLLVLIPLLSIAVSVSVATCLVAALTQVDTVTDWSWWDFKIFKTTKIFVVVILFGAGTDYCLFLIARYREELAKGVSRAQAVADALGNVGDALAASALTTIVGLSMMYFAAFGKYASSGPAVALCLTVALSACLTLAPALLCAFGRIVFWPFSVDLAAAPDKREDPAAGRNFSGGFWERISGMVMARPGLILVVALLLLTPLAYVGTSVDITYDLLAELDHERQSVRGTALLRRHFTAGQTGPVTIVAYQDGAEFKTNDGKNKVQELVNDLYEVEGVASIRSLATVTGIKPRKRGLKDLLKAKVASVYPEAEQAFVSHTPRYDGDVTRLYVILESDPLSYCVDRESPWYGAQFLCVGTTAGIRDLQAVTSSDQIVIQRLVMLAVLMVLLLILKRPVICFYLILSVLFSYFVTIGATQWFFEWLYGDTFHGLDWKVPVFLFVILIAVGEDYNIYLATRVFEEQRLLGLRAGLRRALVQTGGIITSCGIIMAGTFCSMMFGSLRGMTELGFALSLGVLLDTFVVRTVLVPAFFALIIPREAAIEEPVEATAGMVTKAATAPAALQTSQPVDSVRGEVQRSIH